MNPWSLQVEGILDKNTLRNFCKQKQVLKIVAPTFSKVRSFQIEMKSRYRSSRYPKITISSFKLRFRKLSNSHSAEVL